MDAPSAYMWGGYTQHLSPREIEKMRKNMKKVPIIESKAAKYHEKEEEEAEKILSKLHENNNQSNDPKK